MGKRRLEEAIQENADRFAVKITWRPFQLRPSEFRRVASIGTPLCGGDVAVARACVCVCVL